MPTSPEPERSPYVDERFDPLIVSSMPPRFADLELEGFLARHEWLLDRGVRYATITDLSTLVGLPGADTRKRIADFNLRIEGRARRLTLATAIVAPNALLRGAMTAVNWLSPPPYPQAIVADRRAAIDALEGFYREAREPIPAAFGRFRAESTSARAVGA